MTIFDTEPPLSDVEMVEVREYASERIALWRRRALYSTIAFFLSCVAVYPFLAGHPLHNYWDSLGRYLILVSMALLVVFVYCTGLFWSASQALRDVEKGQT
jgi:hypothetical protein